MISGIPPLWTWQDRPACQATVMGRLCDARAEIVYITTEGLQRKLCMNCYNNVWKMRELVAHIREMWVLLTPEDLEQFVAWLSTKDEVPG